MCDELAVDLYRMTMSIGFHAQQNGGPGDIIKTMREIALSSLEMWRRDERSMVNFAKRYLADSIIEWKAWELDMQTAARLWKLQDLCEFIIMELS